MPRTWSAASAKRSSPDAPIGFDESTPPDMFTGNDAAERGVAPLDHLPALAGLGDVVALEPHRLVPAERHVELGAVDLLERVG